MQDKGRGIVVMGKHKYIEKCMLFVFVNNKTIQTSR